jgi:hypothetical protein
MAPRQGGRGHGQRRDDLHLDIRARSECADLPLDESAEAGTGAIRE